jgi:hypothetical protein
MQIPFPPSLLERKVQGGPNPWMAEEMLNIPFIEALSLSLP